MGIFWNYTEQPQAQASTTQLFRTALNAPAPATSADLDKQAQDLATEVSSPPRTQAAELNATNLVVAILIVIAFVGAGIGTNAAGLTTSTTSLFALATTAFGIVVGLLTAEKPTTASKPSAASSPSTTSGGAASTTSGGAASTTSGGAASTPESATSTSTSGQP